MKISIPQPCHENWSEMLPAEKGRFCTSCQKCVTDFTKLSDKEILKILQQPNQCGRFSTNQLEEINRKLKEENQIRFPRIFRYSTLMIGLGLGGTLIAQEKEKVVLVDSIQTCDVPIIKNAKNILVKGQIIDSQGFPSENTLISLKGNPEINTVTDENGMFQIEVPNKQGLLITVEDIIGNVQDHQLSVDRFNTINCCNEIILTGILITKHRTFTGKVLYTLAWPFRQIGKIF